MAEGKRRTGRREEGSEDPVSSRKSGRRAIHFRTDDDMHDAIDALVAEQKAAGNTTATRSSVTRTLLRRALGDEALVGETREVLFQVNRASQAAMNRLVREVSTRFPQYLEDAVRGAE